nr:MAG TPA: BRO family protein [Caudoviricetes sp.]
MENTKSILRIFDNPEFGKVRAVSVNGNPWFVGKDIAEILKYQRTADAISSHVDEGERLPGQAGILLQYAHTESYGNGPFQNQRRYLHQWRRCERGNEDREGDRQGAAVFHQ